MYNLVSCFVSLLISSFPGYLFYFSSLIPSTFSFIGYSNFILSSIPILLLFFGYSIYFSSLIPNTFSFIGYSSFNFSFHTQYYYFCHITLTVTVSVIVSVTVTVSISITSPHRSDSYRIARRRAGSYIQCTRSGHACPSSAPVRKPQVQSGCSCHIPDYRTVHR